MSCRVEDEKDGRQEEDCEYGEVEEVQEEEAQKWDTRYDHVTGQ